MPKTIKPLPTEEEILARFHRLRITIGLSASAFGYASVGNPGIIGRLEKGHKLQVKNRERLSYALDEIEKGHSVPFKSVNKKGTNLDEGRTAVLEKDNSPQAAAAYRSDMED